MKVHTKPYGTIEVDERQKLYFPEGILGFENLKDYIMLDASQQPFYWLQSMDVQEIAFVLIDPTLFRPDYTPDVDRTELDEIGLSGEDDENILIFTIVTIPEDQKNMTANLRGPLIINRGTHTGRQAISQNPKWSTRHNILEELSQVRNTVC